MSDTYDPDKILADPNAHPKHVMYAHINKMCTRCRKVKPVSQFRRQRKDKPYLRPHCVDCLALDAREYAERNREAVNRRSRRYRAENPDKAAQFRRTQQVKKYGLDIHQYNDMRASQGNRCAVCFEPETTLRGGEVQALSIDHNHENGEVRGLLCNRCNRALGMVDDDVSLLFRLAGYLMRGGDPSRPSRKGIRDNGEQWAKCANCGEPYQITGPLADIVFEQTGYQPGGTVCSPRCEKEYNDYLMLEDFR